MTQPLSEDPLCGNGVGPTLSSVFQVFRKPLREEGIDRKAVPPQIITESEPESEPTPTPLLTKVEVICVDDSDSEIAEINYEQFDPDNHRPILRFALLKKGETYLSEEVDDQFVMLRDQFNLPVYWNRSRFILAAEKDVIPTGETKPPTAETREPEEANQPTAPIEERTDHESQ